MEEPDPFAIRQLITNALELCTDSDLLNLVYKLIVTDITQKAG